MSRCNMCGDSLETGVCEECLSLVPDKPSTGDAIAIANHFGSQFERLAKGLGVEMQAEDLADHILRLGAERDYLLKSLVSENAVFLYERATYNRTYEECRKMAEEGILRDLKRIHELEPGETLDDE